MLNQNPQDKLNQQVQQSDTNQRQQDSRGTIDRNQQSKPIDSTPGNPQRPDPKLNSLQDQPSAQLKDEAGNTRQVPEAGNEPGGFIAMLKKKLMETMMDKMTNTESQPRANGDLKAESTPGQESPKPNTGKPTPEPPRPEVKRPTPQQPTPQTPKIQTPRVTAPKFGKLPRIL